MAGVNDSSLHVDLRPKSIGVVCSSLALQKNRVAMTLSRRRHHEQLDIVPIITISLLVCAALVA